MSIVNLHLSKSSVGSFRFVCLSARSIEKIISCVREQSFSVYSFDANNVLDKNSLIEELSKSFQVDQSYAGKIKSWDVICDLMWQSITGRPENKVLLLVCNSDILIRRDMQLFLDAIRSIGFVWANTGRSNSWHSIDNISSCAKRKRIWIF